MSSRWWTAMIRASRPTILLKFGSNASLKKLRNLILSLRWGPRRCCSWLRGLDWLQLASGCLGTVIGPGSGQQQLDRELWGCLLVVRRYWIIIIIIAGLCFAWLSAWLLQVMFSDSSNATCIAGNRSRWCRWQLQLKRKCHYLKWSFLLEFIL